VASAISGLSIRSEDVHAAHRVDLARQGDPGAEQRVLEAGMSLPQALEAVPDALGDGLDGVRDLRDLDTLLVQAVQGGVEQVHPHVGLGDVDREQGAALRVRLEGRGGAPSLRGDLPRLAQHALVDELANEGRDGGRTEPGLGAHLRARDRAVHVDGPQHHEAALAADVLRRLRGHRPSCPVTSPLPGWDVLVSSRSAVGPGPLRALEDTASGGDRLDEQHGAG
jgi:hypothetical protein